MRDLLRRTGLTTSRRSAAPSGTGESWLHLPVTYEAGWPKGPELIRSYERLLAPLREQPIALLELGVSAGDSMTMWRDGLPNATVVGVDIAVPLIDLGPRVHMVQGDQCDGELLTELRKTHAPGGFDVIIDDASHYGELTARSVQALFIENLRPGGLYVIEDWRAGYFIPEPTPVRADELANVSAAEHQVRMPSHDYGMVGLIKRLVDHVAMRPVQEEEPDQPHSPLPLESLTITPGMAVLRRS